MQPFFLTAHVLITHVVEYTIVARMRKTGVADKLPLIDDASEMIKSKKLKNNSKGLCEEKNKYNEKDAKVLTAFCTASVLYQNS